MGAMLLLLRGQGRGGADVGGREHPGVSVCGSGDSSAGARMLSWRVCAVEWRRKTDLVWPLGQQAAPGSRLPGLCAGTCAV